MTCVFFHVFLLFFVWISQVGASGSGKSTIAALLFRHYDPEVRDCPVVPGESLGTRPDFFSELTR